MPGTSETPFCCTLFLANIHQKKLTLNFIEIISQFENRTSKDLKFELLEQHYMPYVFGSGFAAYRIKGRNLRIDFDGRDRAVEVSITPKHLKYPVNEWTSIFSGSVEDFFIRGLNEVKAKIEQ